MTGTVAQRWSFWGGLLTALTVICAVIWAFPLYWGVVSSLKPEDEVVRPFIELWPETLTFQHYKLRGGRGRRDGDLRVHVDALWLRDLAAAVPWADRAMVADPGILHGSDPGIDHQSLQAGR
jgi:hypothetical protein